jgi:hypothetical protein
MLCTQAHDLAIALFPQFVCDDGSGPEAAPKPEMRSGNERGPVPYSRCG